MNIRTFEQPDRDAVVELWRACGLVVDWNDPHRDIARKLQVARELFLVGTIDDEVMATVMGGYEGHRGWINYLAVAPSKQGCGYGGELVAEIETLLIARGCPKINLQVRAGNDAVIAFYQKHGFVDDKAHSMGKRLIADGGTVK